MVRLQRLTTEYDAAHDRILLSGQSEDLTPQAIWLTRRLLRLLLPALVRWLEEQDGAARPALVHSFAQEAARAGIVPQAAVVAESCQAWLAQEVDLGRTADLLCLTFRGGAAAAAIMLSTQQLRQWLSMLQHGATQGGWDMCEWPVWMDPALVVPDGLAVLH